MLPILPMVSTITFYQVKHTINIKDELITYEDLIDPKSKISIREIYSSYRKIRTLVLRFNQDYIKNFM